MALLVTRVDDQLMAAVDQVVDDGVVASRSEAVRVASHGAGVSSCVVR